MTTIVYRDGVLASDSQCGCGGMIEGSTKKITQAKDGTMGGLAGDLSSCTKFLDWVESAERAKTDPPNTGEDEGLLIKPSGEVFVAHNGVLSKLDAPFAILGSGARLAAGAMAMGASAKKAVKIACEFDSGSGGKIQAYRLPGK